MKKLRSLLMYSAAAVFALTSCSEDDDNGGNGGGDDSGNIIKTGEITEDETWETGKVYELGGRVTVTNGATLTIEPGVIVKGQAGSGANATALLISREGKLMAEGTAQQPIIFTSVADEIQPGEIASPNLDSDLSGLWGGLIVLGKAPISASGTEIQIEGIPSSDANGLYGGNQTNHSSGKIKYVSVRHGGTNIGAGNEINGITFGGVGSGTEVENIEVVANQDDGIEWFGGTVNVTNAVVWKANDDGIDTDQDWVGTLDNFVVIDAGDKSFELDGPEGSNFTGDNHTLRNGSIAVVGSAGPLDVDDNTNVDLSNIYFFEFDDSGNQKVTGWGGNTVGSASNFETTLPAGVSVADIFVDVDPSVVTEVAKNANTVGANTSGMGWTWAAQSGALSDLGL